MSPRWAEVSGYGLYLYFDEPHQLPHVAVRKGRARVATVDARTGVVLAGSLPPKDLRTVREFLSEHREAILVAFERTRQHDFPGSLEETKEEDGDG